MSLDGISTARRVLTGALVGGALIVTAGSANATTQNTFNIDVNVTSSEYAVTNIVEFTSGPDGTASGQFSIPQGGGDIFNGFSFTGAPSAYNVMLVGIGGSGGTIDESHTGGLVLFTSSSLNGEGRSFTDVFPSYDEATLISELQIQNPEGSQVQDLANFGFFVADNYGFAAEGGVVTLTAFSDGEIVGHGISSTTPLPAALPLFAGGLGALGLLGWRRKRKA